MTCSTSLSGKNRIVLIAGILMIATTLRVTFTGAAPYWIRFVPLTR
ncbi:membrane protein [Escherichia coli]|uniref:Membrane protein n=1 Tax=Escherichia coli TaxID=562 RepID=A0A2H4TZ70_ECOLX|nr:membrane protein [Escherichia coli]